MKIKPRYRHSKIYRTYEDPQQEYNFLTFLRRKGLTEDADYLEQFNYRHYSSESDNVRSHKTDAMSRTISSNSENHIEVDDYMLSDYVSGMMVNAEILVIQFEEEVKRDLPRSNTPGVTHQPLVGPLHTFINGKLGQEKTRGVRPARAWKFTRFFAGERQVELFFRSKSDAESYANYYQCIYEKLCW